MIVDDEITNVKEKDADDDEDNYDDDEEEDDIEKYTEHDF